MTEEVKQMLVVRKDLNMRKGKIAAQAAHASMKVITDLLDYAELEGYEDPRNENRGAVQGVIVVEDDSALDLWLRGTFTKICVSVNSEAELLEVFDKAQKAFLHCALIQDSGKTEFGGVPTYTCCAVGPAFVKDLDSITGHLPLL